MISHIPNSCNISSKLSFLLFETCPRTSLRSIELSSQPYTKIIPAAIVFLAPITTNSAGNWNHWKREDKQLGMDRPNGLQKIPPEYLGDTCSANL
ncbi:hypothetical protein NPIL_63371 [Nephila pilipes]|uniref:Uncharacterized protein n=1 Tax=Nephila pilipes TaxID=299642 RepID=A0A8X6T565_NEPPI|nr:hypothetical protein NPIL_63371 [Nephila pilipes]